MLRGQIHRRILTQLLNTYIIQARKYLKLNQGYNNMRSTVKPKGLNQTSYKINEEKYSQEWGKNFIL